MEEMQNRLLIAQKAHDVSQKELLIAKKELYKAKADAMLEISDLLTKQLEDLHIKNSQIIYDRKAILVKHKVREIEFKLQELELAHKYREAQKKLQDMEQKMALREDAAELTYIINEIFPFRHLN
jgi:hypothetical protein